MRKKLTILLPNAIILLCNMYFVFYGIDRVNAMMGFIDHDLTKALLTIMCLLTIVVSLMMLKVEKRREELEAYKRKLAAKRRAAERSAGKHA